MLLPKIVVCASVFLATKNKSIDTHFCGAVVLWNAQMFEYALLGAVAHLWSVSWGRDPNYSMLRIRSSCQENERAIKCWYVWSFPLPPHNRRRWRLMKREAEGEGGGNEEQVMVEHYPEAGHEGFNPSRCGELLIWEALPELVLLARLGGLYCLENHRWCTDGNDENTDLTSVCASKTWVST